MADKHPSLTFIGGTGDLGWGLAWRFAKAGFPIIIGSRAEDKAIQVATQMASSGSFNVRGMTNTAAASAGDIVFMTVPFASHEGTLTSIRDAVKGKILVDSTVPLVPPKIMRVQLPATGCVAKQTQEVLGDDVRVVSAFQNVAAAHLGTKMPTLTPAMFWLPATTPMREKLSSNWPPRSALRRGMQGASTTRQSPKL